MQPASLLGDLFVIRDNIVYDLIQRTAFVEQTINRELQTILFLSWSTRRNVFTLKRRCILSSLISSLKLLRSRKSLHLNLWIAMKSGIACKIKDRSRVTPIGGGELEKVKDPRINLWKNFQQTPRGRRKNSCGCCFSSISFSNILVERQYSMEKLDSLFYRTMITFHSNFYSQSKQKGAKDIVTPLPQIILFAIEKVFNFEKVCLADNVFSVSRRITLKPRYWLLGREISSCSLASILNETWLIKFYRSRSTSFGWPIIGQLCNYSGQCIIKRGQSVFQKVGQPFGRRPAAAIPREQQWAVHRPNGVSRW